MALSKKRKASDAGVTDEQPNTTSATPPMTTTDKAGDAESTRKIAETSVDTDQSASTQSKHNTTATSLADSRAARFAALKARAATSAASNLAATRQEASRQTIDPSQLTALSRRQAIATHNLLKAESDSPEAFERKRAWDWTIDESEKWDKRVSKKEKHRDEVGFRNYGEEGSKIYRRQIREMAKEDAKRSSSRPDFHRGDGDGRPDQDVDRLTAYELNKIKTLLSAAQSGGLEIVEAPDGSGELVLLDRHGTYTHPSSNTSTEHIGQQPSRQNVDRLVEDLRKAEETRLRKRRDRGRMNDEMDAAGDVTFINDKNKVFNQKLRRFYDKYTKDIRDSFERGTAM
ncbi:putative pre-mrna-splicing factor syf2 [Phaeomoniella chlamydospora]|uniref:Pre-mRNA-splicing factor SYF2 n=1 Tax=Phaeomoniella chlamydospora TaxID=158046 RepID=A0A0G2DWT2_PHACM|nr:putative pre-mrna-splicing factor syf2 [Phaeomoniella chlamydospora]